MCLIRHLLSWLLGFDGRLVSYSSSLLVNAYPSSVPGALSASAALGDVGFYSSSYVPAYYCYSVSVDAAYF